MTPTAALTGVPGVDGLTPDAGGDLSQPVRGEQFAVDHHVRPALVGDLPQGGAQVSGLLGQDRDAFCQVAVGGGTRYGRTRHPAGSCPRRLWNQASTISAWYQQVKALVRRRVPRLRHSAASSRDR